MIRLSRWVTAGVLMLPLGACVHPAPQTDTVAAAPAALMPEIRIDERVELLSIIFRLAGAPEYSSRHVPSYADAIEAHFGQFREHPAVVAARLLREEGISHDAVQVLAIRLSPLPGLDERIPLEQADLGSRWRPEAARSFLEKVRRFVRDTDAGAFFSQQGPFYAVAERRARALIQHEADMNWLQAFYGGAGNARFVVVPAPGQGTFFYGPAFTSLPKSEEFYAIMGMWVVDEDGFPGFRYDDAPILIHEFGHSFVNPIILDRYEELRPTGDLLLEHFQPEMSVLHYTRGEIILHESVIRAAVARYKLARMGERAARGELQRQREMGFVWIDELYDLLGQYERNRSRYPTFQNFTPVLRQYLSDLAPRVPAMAAAYETSVPNVVEMDPANGAQNVDPSLTTIRLRLDRRVKSYGFVWGPSGRGAYPITSASIDPTQKVITANVRLKPGTSYEIVLIPDQFRSVDNNAPMRPLTWRFTTGPSR